MTSGNNSDTVAAGSNPSASAIVDVVQGDNSEENNRKNPHRRISKSRRIDCLPRLSRLVSQEELTFLAYSNSRQNFVNGSSCNEDECALDLSEHSDSRVLAGTEKDGMTCGRESPMRCVSEFDRVAAASDEESDKADYRHVDDTDASSRDAPPLPNPLQNNKILSAHTRALRIEAALHPLRVVLSRLMAHPTFNRKGLFNYPVDSVALKLPDYHKIVERPMDLGTVKARLHAMAYDSQHEVVEDIRLVFRNAMAYNPPGNPVHTAASSMLGYFEELYATIVDVKDLLPKPSDAADTSICQKTIVETTSLDSEATAEASCSTESHVDLTVNATLDPSLEELKRSEGKVLDRCSGAGHKADIVLCLKNQSGAQPSEQTKQTTRSRPPAAAVTQVKPIRRRRSTQVRAPTHSCEKCLGRICAICNQGCLALEPALLICSGSNCAGARIRKGATYYIAKDGSRQFCQRCYTNLAAVQHLSSPESPKGKSDLLKRKNEEEIAERWLTCDKCGTGVHQICALYNEYAHTASDIPCPVCNSIESAQRVKDASVPEALLAFDDLYTFATGSDLPVPLSSMVDRHVFYREHLLNAESLQETTVSSFIQECVRNKMKDLACPNAERTVLVRIISDCDRVFQVPGVIRKHFRMKSRNDQNGRPISPPSQLTYHSQAIALFQKVDALDVCIFCMYVQEYDGDDILDDAVEKDTAVPQKKRVYIAYLDSVEHFRPRNCRTAVYHEMIVSYLAAARARGFETAHIWACPPSRGNSFVFWNHPASQRTPTKERLESWYHGALSRAVDCGVVTDVQSLYESDFQYSLRELNDNELSLEQSGRMVCPPLFDGDFWIDEAVRIHSAATARNLRARLPGECPSGRGSPSDLEGDERCPAIQVAALLRDRLIAHPSSLAFRRPVNAAAMKLHDYHKIIVNPMDLGTVFSRCVMGEYRFLRDLISDVKLVFSNAKLYNPKGHVVHDGAIELESLFTDELITLLKSWHGGVAEDIPFEWNRYVDLSMSLDNRLDSQVLSNESVPELDSVGCVSMACSDERCSKLNGVCKNMDGELEKESSPPSPSPSLCANDNTMESSKQGDAVSPCSTSDADLPSKMTVFSSLELFSGGPEAIFQRMVGTDTWLLDKKNPTPPKNIVSTKKCGLKRKRSTLDSDDQSKLGRRQAWLGEEVGASVRRMRTSFFACSLVPKTNMSEEDEDKLEVYRKYVEAFASRIKTDSKRSGRVNVSHVADARHALHEFSQYRNFEFDTLRRAKYSTAMLLYHLHNDDAPGLIPTCSSCSREISEVRWHRVRKQGDRPRVYRVASPRGKRSAVEADETPQELCSKCYVKQPRGDGFIPLQVSLKPNDS